jgi:hypothetical protein
VAAAAPAAQMGLARAAVKPAVGNQFCVHFDVRHVQTLVLVETYHFVGKGRPEREARRACARPPATKGWAG